MSFFGPRLHVTEKGICHEGDMRPEVGAMNYSGIHISKYTRSFGENEDHDHNDQTTTTRTRFVENEPTRPGFVIHEERMLGQMDGPVHM